ncbi:MAG: class I SAM-dependent methyltransferase, partial [Pseudomonadota bacterium]
LSYGQTIRIWRERFIAALEQVKSQGYNDAFIRTWLMYLCYCEGSFNEKAISTVQMLFAKPEHI